MKNLSLNEFRDLCDELHLTSRKGEHTVDILLSADDEFDHNVSIAFVINENRIWIYAYVLGYGKELEREKKLEFCNKWNKEKIGPRAYLDSDGDFVVDSSFWTDEEVSAEYIKAVVIRRSMNFFWKFFVELKKHLNNQEPSAEEDSANEDIDEDEND